MKYLKKGITTVLTMVTLIWSTNASLPKISYIKGIDVYLVCCFFMTFASVIEYATVSYVHHQNERRKRKRAQQTQALQQQSQPHQVPINQMQNHVKILRNNSFQLNKSVSEIFNNTKNSNDNETTKTTTLSNTNKHNQHTGHLENCHQNENFCEKECPVVWERKATNDNLDPDVKTVVPIILEKAKTCTCNLRQYSSRQFETHGSNQSHLTTTTSRMQSSHPSPIKSLCADAQYSPLIAKNDYFGHLNNGQKQKFYKNHNLNNSNHHFQQVIIIFWLTIP